MYFFFFAYIFIDSNIQMGKKGLTKKEIRRFTKKELLKICKDNNLPCNSKSSKAELVAQVFKNKQLKNSLQAKPPRKLSEKQRANLARFRFSKSKDKVEDDSAVVRKPIEEVALSKPVKSLVKVDPTASNKNEPAPASLKQDVEKVNRELKRVAQETIKQVAPRKASIPKFIKEEEKVVDFKTGDKVEKKETKSLLIPLDKKTRDRASFNAEKLHQQLGGTQADAKPMSSLDSHTSRLMKRIEMNSKILKNKEREFKASTTKSSDIFDRELFDKTAKRNREQIRNAIILAREKAKREFDGDLDLLEEEIITEASDNLRVTEFMSLIEQRLVRGQITRDQFNTTLSAILNLQSKRNKGELSEETFRNRMSELMKLENEVRNKGINTEEFSEKVEEIQKKKS